ncbi:hypothetical protein [Candidatus Clostridium stratigraminis]|uniref:Uncharacterized protein n=1 Tax=Candidatus Clostridium stratigraminis TaxID=3381661 RepID=A0ABW8SYD8_9CLOT
MLGHKHETADLVSLEAAETLYKDCGVILVVTDGKYIQLGSEER